MTSTLSLDRDSTYRTSRRSSSLLKWSAFSFVAILPWWTGCGPSESTEISSANSGYVPADKASADKSKATTTSNESSTTNQAASTNTATNNPTSVPNASGGALPTAPEVPEFQPGKLDPKIAAKDYMKLQLSSTAQPKELLQFIEKSSKAVRDMVMDARRKQITSELLLSRGMELSRMKKEAAERLSKVATTEDEKVGAVVGTMEALSQMTSFGDVMASDELRELVSRESNSEEKRISQQAKSIALSLVVSDYQAGGAKADEIAKAAEAILSDNDLTATNLNALTQAIQMLSAQSEDNIALDLARKTEEKFRDHADPPVALAAWELHASRLPEAKAISEIMDAESEAGKDPAATRKLAEALMAKIDSPWTAFLFTQIAVNIEYSGRPLIAAELFKLARTQIEKLKSPASKEELQTACDQFDRRLGLIGKPLNLPQLVDTNGAALDLERYKGKVVLVDFWATWCGPCIAELPNIQAVYDKRHQDGFEVIGVNLDETQPPLEKFLAEKKLPWTTYVSDDLKLSGFQQPAAKLSGVAAIPFLVLVGRDGNVVDIHVRGHTLDSRVEELLIQGKTP